MPIVSVGLKSLAGPVEYSGGERERVFVGSWDNRGTRKNQDGSEALQSAPSDGQVGQPESELEVRVSV